MHFQCIMRVITAGSIRRPATAELARVGSHYAVQGHSRSLILVPIESPCDLLFVININFHPIFKCIQLIADYWSKFACLTL